ncbi:MAG TPA: 2-dehydropantoate 2-reductase [Gammaproteobacteria bacterium]|nr:2-dehydropantoate 2-reductase [Gammaproteobacteria bacterium]
MSSPVNVLVIGAGAIGGFYGAILSRAGARVSVLARSDAAVLKERGYKIQSPLGDLSYRPAEVYASAEEITTPPDYLIVALKVVEGVDRVGIIRPAVGPNTAIVLIQNGIGIEQEVAEAFPNNPLISCLAFIAVSRIAPGELDHKAYGALTFGDYPKGAGKQAQRFAELLQAGGVESRLSEDVVAERWRKCVWNTPFNPASVLAGGADTQTLLTTAGGEELIRGFMEEVCATAAADGYPLPDGIIDGNIRSTLKMPAYHNSMALDFLNGREMEIEPILGNVVRIAERHGVPVPRLATMYALLQLLVANRAKSGR